MIGIARLTLPICALVVAWGAASVARSDVVKRHLVKFEIEYDDGVRETAAVRYEAHLDPVCLQSSSEATTTEAEESRVRLSVKGSIQRDVCIFSRALGESCGAIWTKVFDGYGEKRTQGRWQTFLSVVNDTTCKKQRDRLRSAAQEIQDALVSAIPDIVKSDLDEALGLVKVSGVKQIVRRD